MHHSCGKMRFPALSQDTCALLEPSLSQDTCAFLEPSLVKRLAYVCCDFSCFCQLIFHFPYYVFAFILFNQTKTVGRTRKFGFSCHKCRFEIIFSLSKQPFIILSLYLTQNVFLNLMYLNLWHKSDQYCWCWSN